MKLSDYIASFLAERGVTHAFGMSGGAAVHMFDSIDRRSDISVISMTHEQAAAMAADGYARASGRLGVAITTSGPGATNLLTGTCCSYYDSIPTLMLTGQVATHRLRGERQVRQVGFQETDVVAIFRSVTKYAAQLTDPADIRYQLERAYHSAFEGRPGPVLLDIPDDLQRADVDPEHLRGYEPDPGLDARALEGEIDDLLERIRRAERPVVILGGGLKTPFVGDILRDCIDRLGIPALVSWAGLDLLPGDHPLRVGTFGVYGPRAGNFAIQNADLVIALGTRLSQNLTGGVLSSFAREAVIAMVDVDAHEMSKFEGRGIQISVRIQARLDDFLRQLRPKLETFEGPDRATWLAKVQHWKTLFPPDTLPASNESSLEAYGFIDGLSKTLPLDALVYIDTGGNLTWTCNGLRPKAGHRVHSAWNNTPMGYALPAAIGAAFFDPSQSITCVIGDGGLMLCLGELATVAHHQLPIRIVLLNNHGHGIQKQTLETWLDARYVCVHPESGLAFPSDFARVAEALGVPAVTIDRQSDVSQVLSDAYARPDAVLINVEIDPCQKLYPVLKFGLPLEQQYPPLPPELVDSEMIVEPFEGASTAAARAQASQGW